VEKLVLVLIGPTASGKTELSYFVYRWLKEINLEAEIISADSRQFYKILSIGTAKPTNEELKILKHNFVDFLNPDVDYNISKFENDALKKIEELFKESKIPIVVGGSGLYIKSLIEGIFSEVDTDEKLRAELKRIKEEKGNEFIYDMLKEADPYTAEKMLPSNWKRVIRALEVFQLTGKSFRRLQETYKRQTDVKFLQVGLNWDRDVLYQNIEMRVDKMIKQGLVEEVKAILNMGYSKELNSLNTVGYKEIIKYLENEISLERAIELIKRNTRRFAKRQLTWFRADKSIKWFNINDKNELPEIAKQIVTDYLKIVSEK